MVIPCFHEAVILHVPPLLPNASSNGSKKSEASTHACELLTNFTRVQDMEELQLKAFVKNVLGMVRVLC
jgi:hypothetical protein